MNGLPDSKLFAEFSANPPASARAIEQCQMELGLSLPDDYLRFLRTMNGGKGSIGENGYLILWGSGDMVEENAARKSAGAPSELCLFGSDGAGEAFAFDMRVNPPPIVAVPFVGLDWDDAILIAADFRGFLETLYKSGIPFCKGRRYGAEATC
jgi:hypothetical protein